MKRAPGLVIISVLLVLFGLQMFRNLANAPSGTRTALTGGYLVLALLSLAAGVSLWRGAANAVALYWVWAAAYLVMAGSFEYFCGGNPISVVVLWGALVGTVLLAAGLHVRHALRQAV